jgi:hypothetical protein
MAGGMKGNSPNPLRRTLGLIHGDEHRNHSDTQTCKYTTDNEERKSGGGDLHGNTDGEDEDGEDNGPSPTEEICGGGCEEGAEKGSGRQDGDDEGLLRRGDGANSCRRIAFSEGAQPIPHGLNSGNDTCIVAKENTTKGGEEGLYDGQNIG